MITRKSKVLKGGSQAESQNPTVTERRLQTDTEPNHNRTAQKFKTEKPSTRSGGGLY